MKINKKKCLQTIIFIILWNIFLWIPYITGVFNKGHLTLELRSNLLALWLAGLVTIVVSVIVIAIGVFLIVIAVTVSERLCERFLDIYDNKK